MTHRLIWLTSNILSFAITTYKISPKTLFFTPTSSLGLCLPLVHIQSLATWPRYDLSVHSPCTQLVPGVSQANEHEVRTPVSLRILHTEKEGEGSYSSEIKEVTTDSRMRTMGILIGKLRFLNFNLKPPTKTNLGMVLMRTVPKQKTKSGTS